MCVRVPHGYVKVFTYASVCPCKIVCVRPCVSACQRVHALMPQRHIVGRRVCVGFRRCTVPLLVGFG